MKAIIKTNNAHGSYYCCDMDHDHSIAPGKQYVDLTITSAYDGPYNVIYCLPCADKIFEEIRPAFDSNIRFYG